MKRNNEVNDGSRVGGGGEEAKRQRSLSESTFGDNNNNNNNQHLLLHQDADNWLLANQQRRQMLAQSDALMAAATGPGGRYHHQLHHQQPPLNLQQLDDLNPAGSLGGGIPDGASSCDQPQEPAQAPLLLSPPPPSRALALENAQTQLAAAMIRQRQAEDTLRQCQQQQAVAVAEYLQQQAAASLQQQQLQQQQHQSPLHHHHQYGSLLQGSSSIGSPTGASSNMMSNAAVEAATSHRPQIPHAVRSDPTGGARSGGLFDLVQQQQQVLTNQQQAAAMSRSNNNTNSSIAAAAAAAGGMSFGAGHERIYCIPVDHFASYPTATTTTTNERIVVPNRHAAAATTTTTNHDTAAAAAAAVFNSPMGQDATTATAFNGSNGSMVPGYSSFLLSSAPTPLNSHLLLPSMQLASSVAASGGDGDDDKDDTKKVGLPRLTSSSPKPRKSGKSKSSGTSSSAAAAGTAGSTTTPPKISIAGPKRRPVSLQALVNRGDACYDPGPVRELALPSDRGNLSEYQCLLRKQIVLFSVSINDIQCSAQGRNKPIVIGQVGVLCRHCARIPPGMRPCGASYFPGKLSGLYQAAQNMAINHLTKSCRSIADDTKETLIKLKAQKSTVLGGGKNFWANGAKVLGVVEVEEGHLRFLDG